MSDNSESSSDDGGRSDKLNGKSDDICRDFLRNVCKRGMRCRYRHPNADEARVLGRKQEYTFCHDFQNTGCNRNNCRFLHCTREEEEHYKQTGQLPVRLQQAAALGIGVTPNNELPILRGEVPICKDYLKGDCKRGNKCKFRHINVSEYEFELRKSQRRDSKKSQLYDPYEDEFEKFECFEYHGAVKRRRSDREYDNGDSSYNNYNGRFSSSTRPYSYQLLEEENAMLRRKVNELKKQVTDLTATNEVLLEQNARYRVSRSNLQPLTVNQTLTPTVGATAAQAPPTQLNHLATSLAQQIALNSELASQHALQQRIAREMAAPPAQPGSIGAPPPLNPSVTMNPANIVPVSISQTNLPGVSIASVSIQQTLPPTVSMNQNMQGAPSTLVSYPIMSQSIRSAASSLAH